MDQNGLAVPTLADMLSSESFYGEHLKQRPEKSGRLVDFAGHILFDEQCKLSSRINNVNVTYTDSGHSEYRLAVQRFSAFTPAHRTSSKKGQLLGHVFRVLDHSNLNSVLHVPTDLTYLWWELKASGWPADMFREALDRAAGNSVLLHKVMNVTKQLMRR